MGQRGRPPVLPADNTPFDGPMVDVEARLGWLLRVNRLCSPDPDNRSLSRFAARLRAAGITADTAGVSRWETGRTSARLSVLAGYERLLDLPGGALRSAAAGLRAALGVRTAPAPGPPTDLLVIRDRLDVAYGQVTGPAPDGGGWFELAELLGATERVLLPTTLVEGLVMRLLDEMMRSVGTAYTTRYSALTTLIGHPLLTATVTRGIEAVAHEPGAQGVIDAIALLGEVGSTRITGQLLAMFAGDAAPLRIGSAYALLNLMVTGVFPADRTAELEQVLHRVAVEDPDGGAGLALMVGRRLAPDSRQRAGLPAVRTEPAPRPTPGDTAWLGRFLAAGREYTGIEDDPMLGRLVREAMVSRFVERRHHAALLLLTGPYRAALGSVAADLVETTPDAAVRQAAAGLLRYLVGAAQRPRLHRWLTADRADLRAIGLGALAHAGGPATAVDLAALATRPESPSGTLVYAAGMTGHPVLRGWSDDPSARPALRRSARWWLRHGPAVHDTT